MRKLNSYRWMLILGVMALLVAACSPSDSADTTEAATATTEAAPDTTEGAPDTTAAPDTTEAAPMEPLKIGQLSDLTSTFTPWGLNVRDGMALAAKEINDAGGVGGRMIEIFVQDSENDPDAAATGWDRLVEEGVVAVGGVISSGVSP
ncbi:MAG: ABC transporter substrate-binding protein, partial [Acidimicrobiia bacterium]